MTLRSDLQVIADWIAPGSRVLDLGCGDGALLSFLQREKQCQGYGVEIDPDALLAAMRASVFLAICEPLRTQSTARLSALLATMCL